jgi:hypothetical protein
MDIKTYQHTIDQPIDCQIQHLDDIMQTAGLSLSAYQIFGLSEGIGFSIEQVKLNGFPYLIILGRSRTNLETLCSKFSISYRTGKITDPQEFKALVASTKNTNRIVLAYTDRFYLTYVNQHLAKNDTYFTPQHFSAHLIAVLDYSEGVYRVFDLFSKHVELVPEAEMQEARTARWDVYPPLGKYLLITIPHLDRRNFDLTRMTINSIIANCRRMLAEDDSNAGIAGLRLLAKESKSFVPINTSLYQSALRFQFGVLGVLINEFEMTGSLYREVYARFLDESAALGATYESLKSSAKELHSLGKRWKSFGLSLQSDDVRTVAQTFSPTINKLAEDELTCWKNLLKRAETIRDDMS